MRETAAEAGIDAHIRYGHRVVRAEWSTPDARWTVHAEGREPLTCRFLLMCSGYYRYDEGFTPPFEGREDFGGEIVHPQFWPRGPRLRRQARRRDRQRRDRGHARPRARAHRRRARDDAPALAVLHPLDARRGRDRERAAAAGSATGAAYAIVRWKNVALATLLFQLSQRFPRPMRKLYRAGALRQLPAGYAVDTHFNPRYKPWDQRLCLVPNGDLFEAISDGSAEIVTAEIDRFTERGIRLRDGAELEADVIVTATGLNLLAVRRDGARASTASRSTCRARWPTSR